MTEFDRYEALQEYNRFETLVNTEEYVTEDEFNFIVKYDKTEESNFSLVNSQYGDYLNLNVYSEYDHEKRANEMEIG